MNLIKTIVWFLLFKIWEIFILFPFYTLKTIGRILIAIGKLMYDYWVVPLIYSLSFYVVARQFFEQSRSTETLILSGFFSIFVTLVLCLILNGILFIKVSGYNDLEDVGEVIINFIKSNWKKAEAKAGGKK